MTEGRAFIGVVQWNILRFSNRGGPPHFKNYCHFLAPNFKVRLALRTFKRVPKSPIFRTNFISKEYRSFSLYAWLGYLTILKICREMQALALPHMPRRWSLWILKSRQPVAVSLKPFRVGNFLIHDLSVVSECGSKDA
jgi:hypothetical protein